MKKVTALVLAIAMVLSLATFQIFTTAEAAGEPEPPANDEFYGIGASGLENIDIEFQETSKVPHIKGNTITYAVTVTNNGPDITGNSTVKVEIYDNGDGYLTSNSIFESKQLDFPTPHSTKFAITDAKVEGTLCGEKNPSISVSSSSKFNLSSKVSPLMGAGTKITFNISCTISESDIENGYIRNLIVVYLGRSDGKFAVGKYLQTEVFDESENVGSLTVSNTNGTGDEQYTITLEDKNYATSSDEASDIVFVNGEVEFKLSSNASKIIKIPVGGFTVTVTNPSGKIITYTVNGDESGSGSKYSGSMTKGESISVVFDFAENTSTDKPYKLTYHFNAPSGYNDSKVTTDDFPVEQSNNDFIVKDLKDKDNGVFTTLTGYSIKATVNGEDKNYYFCGWADKPLGTDARYTDITFPITKLSSNTRGFDDDEIYIVEDDGGRGSGDLYAVWLPNPGLVGYSMSVQGGHFASRTETSDNQKLGDNGLTNWGTPVDPTLPHAQKFVVHDSGHDDEDVFTVTSEKPTLSGYNFLTWFNKAANDGKGDPNDKNIVMPGDTFKFGTTKTIYSLDAVWGKVEGAKDVVVPYDGGNHNINIDDLASYIRGAGYKQSQESQVNAFKAAFGVDAQTMPNKDDLTLTGNLKSEKITYHYTVKKDGNIVSDNVTEIPTFSEPGVYEYSITAVIKVDKKGGNSPAEEVDIEIGTVSATLTILPVRSLTVTKLVKNGEDPDEEFTFTVTLTNISTEKSYVYRILDADGEQIKSENFTVTSGTATVTVQLKDGGSVEFDNLPDDTQYSVEENNLRDGFKSEVTDGTASGTITSANKEQRAIFTNTYETGDLTISKTVTGAGISDGFEFTVTLKDSKGTVLSNDQIFAYTGSKTGSIKSGDRVKLNGGESIVIHDLPLGTQYTVTETSYTDYTTSVENNGTGKAESSTAEGTISTTSGATVAFTNEQNKGGLTITKNVTGGTGVSVNQKFTFTVTQTAPAEKFSGTVHLSGGGTVNFENGVGTVEVQVNGTSGSVTLEDLPAGTYTVAEQATGLPDNRYEIQTPGSSVKINKGTTQTVSFTNTLKTGSLNVTKKFEQSEELLDSSTTPAAGWNEKPVTFTVTFTLPGWISEFTVSYGSETKAITAADNTIQFTLTSPNYTNYTISGIPYGVGYQFTEKSVGDDTNHYVSSFANGSGTISAASADVTCTNTYHLVPTGYGVLAIKKEVVGHTDQTDFKFRVTYDGKTEDVTVNKDGYATVLIPKGKEYTVEEIFDGGQTRPTNIAISFSDAEDDEKVVDGKATGTISSEYSNDTVIFQNQYLSDLTITKTVEKGGYTLDPAESFKFTVQFSGDDLSKVTVNYGIGADRSATLGTGDVNIKLKAEDTVTFEGLPVGTTYTVTESAETRGEEVKINGTTDEDAKIEGTVQAGSNAVNFTNVYKTVKTGSITITKKVDGEGRKPEAGTEFTVEVTLTEEGKAAYTHTYTLTADSSVTLDNIPYGTKYTVEETNSQGAEKISYTSKEGTLEDKSVTVIVTNTYNTKYGDLTISKKVEGENAPTDQTFTFTITAEPGKIADGKTFTVDGTSNSITFNDGIPEVEMTLTGLSGSVTIKDLPEGNYTVAEKDVPENYSVDPVTLTKELKDGSVTFDFTNTYNQPTGSLSITKNVQVQGTGVAVPTVTGTFTFTVTPVDGTPMSEGVTATGGKVERNTGSYTVTLEYSSTNKTVTLNNLPTGQYTVTEDTGSLGELYGEPVVTAGNANVEKGETAQVNVKNTVQTGTLTVSKEVDGSGLPSDIAIKPFTFTVTLELPAGVTSATVTYGGESMAITGSGTVSFTLTRGSSLTISGIPYGTYYTVKETLEGADEHYYSQSSEGAAGTISASNTDANATVTNTYHEAAKDTGTLILKKVTQGETVQSDFTFSVTFTYNGTEHRALFEDFAAKQGGTLNPGDKEFTVTYTVPKGGSVTIHNIPVGTSYTVTEVITSEMTGDKEPSDIIAELTDAESGTVTNEYKNSGKVSATGVIDEDTDADTVTFYNRYLVDIVISKELAGEGNDKPGVEQEFEFTVELSGISTDDLNKLSGIMKIEDARSTRTFEDLIRDFEEDNKVTVYVSVNKHATIYQVPAGVTHYIITEVKDEHVDKVEVKIGEGEYSESNTTTTGKQTAYNSTAKVTFRNTYDKTFGDLTIGKEVEGLGADTGKEFTFTVTLEGDDISGGQTFTYDYDGSGESGTIGSGGTVTLRDGQSITIHGIPHGTQYTVSEAQYGDYAAAFVNDGTEGTGNATGTIVGESEKTVTFTNSRKTGSLTVEKKITGGQNVRVKDTFTFTVESSVKFTGKVGYVEFTDGVATVEVPVDGDTGSVILEGLPTGTYTVTEEDASPVYTTTGSGATAEVKEGVPATVTVTNEIGVGSLTVSKDVTANNSRAPAPDDAEFTVKVTFTLPEEITGFDAACGGVTKAVVNNTTLTFTLKHGESFKIENIPYGVGYTVSEDLADDQEGHYEVTYSNGLGRVIPNRGEINDGNPDPSVTVHNKYFAILENTGSLWVLKRVKGTFTDAPESYTFTVTFTQNGVDKTTFDAFLESLGEGVSGSTYTFTLTDGANKVIYDIPVGVSYTLKEVFEPSAVKPTVAIDTDNPDPTTEISEPAFTVTGTIDASRDQDGFTFNNNYLTSLTVTKEVERPTYAQDTRDTFDFTVHFSGENLADFEVRYKIPGGAEGTVDKDGDARFSLKSGQTVTFTGIPAGTRYTVTEDSGSRGETVMVNGVENTAASVSGTVDVDADNNKVTFTNVYTKLKTGTIVITKSVTGSGRMPADGTLFPLKITLTDADNKPLSGNFGGVSFDVNGVGTYSIEAGKTLRLENVPLGTKFTVEELNNQGADEVHYSLNGSSQLMDEESGSKITVTNVYNTTYGNLKISKEVAGGGAETDVDFTFHVTLTGAGISGKTFSFDGSKSGTVTDGQLTVTLRGGQSITIRDLPNGTGYTVTEDTNVNYTSASENASGTVSGNATITAAFTNTRKTGSLVIEKSLTGADVKVKETFFFKITPVNGTRMSNEGVTGATPNRAGFYITSVTLDGTSSGSVTVSGLPTGDYTVEEQEAGLGGLYKVPDPVRVTVPEGSVTAEIENEIQTGSLSVTKVFELSEKLRSNPSVVKSGWNEKTVTFTVTFSLPDHIQEFTVTHGDNKKATINGTTRSFTFTLDKDHYEDYPISGIPYGVEYELTETAVGSDSDYYVDTYVNGGGTVSASAPSIDVTCTNTYHLVAKGNGALIIRKDVVGETSQTEFTFDVSYGTTTNRVTVMNGGYELVEVPIDTPYTVTEVFGTGETEPTKTLMLRGKDLEPGDGETTGRTFSGVIDKEYDSDSVQYVNMYLADLTVTKVVDVSKYAQGPDADQEFSLFIDFSGSTNYEGLTVTYSVNGGEKKSIDRPGTLELRLKAGDVVTFFGIPVGASHTITENAATRGESVVITSSNAADTIDNDKASTSGTIVSGGVDIVFTNKYTTPKTGSITVEKKVEGEGRRPEAGTRYTVTVELTDAGGRHLSGTYGGQEPDVNGLRTFELEDGESVKLENVPYGTRYIVRETNSRNADDVTITGGDAVLESDAVTVTVVNTFSTTYGDLEIGKEVSGLGGDTKKPFSFTVTFTDADGNRLTQEYDYSGSSSGKVTNGELHFTLAHGEKITIHGLPNGTKYAIQETGDTDYTTTYSVNGAAAVEGSLAQGSIDTGTNPAKVFFTNTRKSGRLTIEKSLANGLEVDRTFTFTVKSSVSFTGRARLSTGEYVTFTNGEARDVTIAVDGGSGSVTLVGLPTGTYTVTETDTGAFTPAYAGSGVIEADGTATIKVTNTIATGSLTVTKKVTSNNPDPSAQAPAGAKFQIKVTFTLPADIEEFTATVNGTGTPLHNGDSLTLTLGNGDTQTVTGIPYGVYYEVSEAFDDNYEVTYTGGVSSGTVSASNTAPSVTVNNKYFALEEGTGALWIFKEVQGSSPSMPRSYTFQVEFEQGTANADDYQAFLETLGISSTQIYSFTLRANERKIIMAIPEGARYTVSEVFGGAVVKPANVVVTASECESATVSNGTAGTDGTLSTPTARGAIDTSRDVDGFTFYNQYLADLKLEFIVDPSVPDGTEFEFTLKFSGLQAQQVSSIMKIDDANGTRESGQLLEDFIPDDEVTITLRKDSTARSANPLVATIYNVPIGVSHYVITATGDNLGDTVTWDVSSVKVPEPLHSGLNTGSQTFSEERSYVTFKNAYNGGWLTVEKGIAGRKPSVDEEYTFTVTPVGGTEPAETFTVTGEGTKSIPLPAGEYTVTETAWGGSSSTTVKVGTGASVPGKSANVTVARTGEVTVTFTNTYTGGNVLPPLDQSHHSYVVGYPDGTVRPNGSITRAEVVSILYRLLTDSARDANRVTTNTFDDVNEGAWYNLAVSTLQNMGAVSGYGDGTFRPDQPITRAEMAALIGQFYHVHKTEVQGHYDDVPEDQWFTAFVDFVTEQGIMVGVGGGNFEPYRNLTRAEAMAVFNRILGRTPDKFSFDDVVNDPDYVTWPDNANPEVWYYADVQEATNSHDYQTRSDNKELWTDARGMKHWEG